MPFSARRAIARRAIALGLVASVAVLAGGALPAAAATTTTTPAAGSANSELSLLTLSSGVGRVGVGMVTLKAATTPAATAGVDLIPAEVGNQEIGAVQIGPGQSQTVAPVTASLPVGSLTGPSLQAAASTTGGEPVASVVANALGQASIAGAPLSLGIASLRDTTMVSATSAVASKVLQINDVALPSIAALLAGLGLNLDALSATELSDLYAVVAATATSTVSAAVSAAESGVTAAMSAVGAGAPATLGGADALVTKDQSAANTAAATFTSALQTAAATVPGLTLPATVTPSTWTSLTTTEQSALELANASLPSLYASWQQAQAALTAAQQLVIALTKLIGAVSAALSANPLAALNGITLAASATASDTPAATAVAEVGSFDVLGQVSPNLQAFAATLNGISAKLASVIDGLGTGASFTAPTVAVGAVTHSTGRSGVFRTAQATVTGIELTLPKLSLPAGFALPHLASATAGGSLVIGQLVEAAQYRPASQVTVAAPAPAAPATTKTVAPGLPETGLPSGVPLTAIALLSVGLAGLLLRRRLNRAARSRS
ncbi:MAG: hypothetical protein ACYCO3_01155 [Mycobacteriales bacterium]